MIYTHRESYGGARRGTIIKIERRKIHGYIGRTLKKNREVMIQDAIRVTRINPENQKGHNTQPDSGQYSNTDYTD